MNSDDKLMKIDSKLIFETQRLLLEEATLADGPFFFELLNSPGWLEFIGDRGIKTLADAERYIESSLIRSYRENGFGLYKIMLKEAEVAIGVCGLLKRFHLAHADLGFAMLPAYEKKGYCYEAAMGVLNYAGSSLQLKTVLAFTTQQNVKSQNLLRKLKFRMIEIVPATDSDPEFLLFST